jgi:hypothetical protein
MGGLEGRFNTEPGIDIDSIQYYDTMPDIRSLYLSWWDKAKIYHGLLKTKHFSGKHIFVSGYEENEYLQNLTNKLSGSDVEAHVASSTLKSLWEKGEIWVGCGVDVVTAFNNLVEEMRIWFIQH